MGRKRKQKQAGPVARDATAAVVRVAVSLATKLQSHQARLNAAEKAAPGQPTGAKSALPKQAPQSAPPRSGGSGARRVGPNTLHPPGPRPLERVPEPGAVPLSAADRALLDRALAGVAPLAKKQGRAALARAPSRIDHEVSVRDDMEVRARLGALVGGGIQFSIEHDSSGEVHGRRSDAKPGTIDAMYGARWQPQATLDLHGQRADEAPVVLARFVRSHHQRGARRLLVVHGKGLHSDGGVGVLQDAVVQALSAGGAAPLVLAFATARRNLGGLGAMMVQLGA